MDTRFIGDVQRLELRPADVLVLNCPGRISDEMAARLRHNLTAQFEGRHKVLVLCDGLTVGVLGSGGAVNGAQEAFAEFGPLVPLQ